MKNEIRILTLHPQRCLQCVVVETTAANKDENSVELVVSVRRCNGFYCDLQLQSFVR